MVLFACVPVVHAAPLVTDDFSQPLENSWSVIEGAWTGRNGQASAEGEFCRMVNKYFTGQDMEVTVDVAYVSEEPNGAAGIQVRVKDDGTGYVIGLREMEKGKDWERPVIQLHRMEKDGWKLLQESKVMNCRSGELRKIKVRCKGADIFVYYEDMETPVLREFDDVHESPGGVALWKDQTGGALFDNFSIANAEGATEAASRVDWSWVKGAVYVRSDAVNSVEMWQDYWSHVDLMDRELGYAATYGFNMVQVYLQWISFNALGAEEYHKRMEDFLTRAARHGLKVNFIFWDDCGHVEPSLDFKPPVPGRHNSQMMMNPSHRIRDSGTEMEAHRERFKGYVAGIAARFKNDPRISFWQIYNEALGAKEKYRTSETDANINTLMKWSRDWIKSTGTKIPLTATAGGFYGPKYSDFPTYHSYVMGANVLPNADAGPEHLCTETLNRPDAPLGKVIKDIAGKKNGFIVWELMIGRDNCRFPWGHPDGFDEPAVPFHGVIYPDGHPWDVEEVKDLLGPEAFAKRGFFEVTYFAGDFEKEIKKSVTPTIDFSLGDEPGTGSPDASAGIVKDNFSIRWEGDFVAPASGNFQFSVTTDGRAKIRVGEKVVIEKAAGPDDGAVGEASLDKGIRYPVTIEYYHRSGPASIAVRGIPARVN